MKKKLLAGLALGVMMLGMVGVAKATPVAIGLNEFSGSETVIDFSSIGNEVLINSQYSGSDVTFSGSLYGMTNSGDLSQFPNNGDGVIASNWLYSIGSQGTWFDVDFANVLTRVGFYIEHWPTDDLTITLEYNGTSSGSVAFLSSSLYSEFVGVEDINGFNRIRVSVASNINGFYAIDNFRFEGAVAPVPEPATMLLMGTGLAGLVAARRKKK